MEYIENEIGRVGASLGVVGGGADDEGYRGGGGRGRGGNNDTMAEEASLVKLELSHGTSPNSGGNPLRFIR